ncbi:MAG: hypothetical protein HQL75_08875 [Magnetococcales bacterium]|nr:hypothetical protein [Magnetococcales bacterium]
MTNNHDRNLSDGEQESLGSLLVWKVGQFFHNRLIDLVLFLRKYVDDNGIAELETLLGLEHSDRMAAENALSAFLKTQKTLTTSKLLRSSSIGRRTDWARTLAESLGSTPLHYWERSVVSSPDTQLLSALVQLARLWSEELNAFAALRNGVGDRFQERARKLERACNNWHLAVQPTRLDANILHRIRNHDNGVRLAELLQKQMFLLERPYEPEKHADILFNVIASKKSHPENADTALEIIATISLLHAAFRNGWKPVPQSSPDAKGHSSLVKDGFTLKVGKGCPFKGSNKVNDRSIRHLGSLGYKAIGKDPDIWLQFCSNDSNKTISILGDAKRNETGDGKHYIPHSFWAMVNYLVAFGHHCQVKLGSDPDDFFKGPVYPSVLLFFKKLPNKQEGTEIEECMIRGLSFAKKDFGYILSEEKGPNTLQELFASLEGQVRAFLSAPETSPSIPG